MGFDTRFQVFQAVVSFPGSSDDSYLSADEEPGDGPSHSEVVTGNPPPTGTALDPTSAFTRWIIRIEAVVKRQRCAAE